MSPWFFTALIYLFGFVGLASIGILPLRAWKALRSAFEGSLAPTARTASLVFIALMAAVALWADMQITIRIFKCLTESYCGPSVASGWAYLAMFGAVYFIFEVVVFVIQKINRAGTGSASSS